MILELCFAARSLGVIAEGSYYRQAWREYFFIVFYFIARALRREARPRFFIFKKKIMARKNNVSEVATYRIALNLIKKRIDLFGEVIDPSAEEMRFAYTEIQRIVDNALSYAPRTED